MLKKIKQYFAIRKAIKRFNLLGTMVDSIDRAFAKKNIPSWQRKQFWRDFIRSPGGRKKFIQDMKKGSAELK